MSDLRPAPDLQTLRQRRRNLRALSRYLIVLVVIVTLHTVLFHVIMRSVEGLRYSLLTGVYWTLSTMSTLGVGDIVFTSALGRAFTIVVLLSGIVLLLVVLPFAFIQFFYAPWIEKRRIPDGISGHVIITTFDNIAPALIERLELHDIPYYVIEPNASRVRELLGDGISAVSGPVDDRRTYDRLRASSARLVVANGEDTTNTNVTLTVREAAPSVPLAVLADNEASIDILELAGASKVLALREELGEHLANRLNAGHAQTHVIGTFRDRSIAEVPLHNTPFVGRTLRDLGLRDAFGINVLGVLDHSKFQAPHPDTPLAEHAVLIVLGSEEQMIALDELLVIYDANYRPVMVIGGGKVGRATTRVLKRKGIPVHMIEKNHELRRQIRDLPDRLFVGDAAELEVIEAAGVRDAPGVAITSNDDAMNIYLTVYCRRLAPEIRIVSRITHERNREAIHRAGADVVLSHITLGVESTFALLRGHELVVLGAGVELHELAIPRSLVDKTLADSRIATRTGLNVVAVQEPDRLVTNPGSSTRLPAASTLVMIGDQTQLTAFANNFG